MTVPQSEELPANAVDDCITGATMPFTLVVNQSSGWPLVHDSKPAFGIWASAKEKGTNKNKTAIKCFIVCLQKVGGSLFI